MNVNEEAGKNSGAGRIKCHWVEKKFLQDLLYTIVLYKTLIEKYFYLVQQSPKFERINKQLNEIIRRHWFLLRVSVGKMKVYVNYIKRRQWFIYL